MKIVRAIEFAREKHKGQIRKSSGTPYVTHPIIVGELLRKFKPDSKNITDLVVASILHDVLEDTDATIQEVVERFGDLVGSLVIELTSKKDVIDLSISKNEYLIEKMMGMTSYALTIKLCDRLSNIIDGPTENYLLDTRVMIDRLKNGLFLTKTEKKIIEEIEIVLNRELKKD